MTTLFSRALYLGATGNGVDQSPELQHDTVGAAPHGHVGAEPWESVSINIVGVEVAIEQGTPAYFIVGNSFSPDFMLTLGTGTTGGRNWFPDGLSFPFPAIGEPTPSHIGVHVNFPNGQGYQAFITIYYTKNAT